MVQIRIFKDTIGDVRRALGEQIKDASTNIGSVSFVDNENTTHIIPTDVFLLCRIEIDEDK